MLREVGTTNRTHLRDYAAAIGPDTALLLKVHTSNYRVVGFTARPASRELAELGRDRGMPVIEDLGSGSLIDLRAGGEPTVPERGLRRGSRAVLRRQAPRRAAGRHPGRPGRAGRAAGPEPAGPGGPADKLTLAALEATLAAHLAGHRDELPVWRSLLLTVADLQPRAAALAATLGPAASLRTGTSVAGGGSPPRARAWRAS